MAMETRGQEEFGASASPTVGHTPDLSEADQKKAKLKLSLQAESGYNATFNYDVSPNDWGRIVALCEDGAQAKVMKAAPELFEALRAAQALATCCMATGCYSHEELTEMARATKPTLDAAIAKAQQP